MNSFLVERFYQSKPPQVNGKFAKVCIKTFKIQSFSKFCHFWLILGSFCHTKKVQNRQKIHVKPTL